MKTLFLIAPIFILFFISCRNSSRENESIVIAPGQMPNVSTDRAGNIYIVYGNGDSILTTNSSNQGTTFSTPALVAVVPELAASHMRGPQIAVTTNGIIITACNRRGDIFSFSKEAAGEWTQSGRVNDVDTIAKENLMALAADGGSRREM